MDPRQKHVRPDSRTVAGQSSRWLKPSQGKLVGAEAGTPGARQYKIDLAGTSPNNRDKRYRVRIDITGGPDWVEARYTGYMGNGGMMGGFEVVQAGTGSNGS